jgi:hypothetical protein
MKRTTATMYRDRMKSVSCRKLAVYISRRAS